MSFRFRARRGIVSFKGEDHNGNPDTRCAVEDVQGGVLLKPLSNFPATILQSGLGCVGYNGVAKSLDEMQAAIDDETARSWRKE